MPYYSLTGIESVNGFILLLVLSFTVNVTTPGWFAACNVTTSLPLNRCICGCVKDSSEVASPLHIPLKVPAPLTLTAMRSVASGISIPFLSSNEIVTYTKSSPSARSIWRSADIFSVAAFPAVWTTCSPAFSPLSSKTTTFSSPGS